MMYTAGTMCHPSHVLELPETWLALLLQHVASGPGGLANAAALNQTCKSFHSLSESSAVTYVNIHVEEAIISPYHDVWQWLAARQGQVIGLSIKVLLDMPADSDSEEDDEDVLTPLYNWEQPLQWLLPVLSAIPDLNLTVEWSAPISTPDHPFMTQWVQPHGYLINNLVAKLLIEPNGLTLKDFCEAAAACKALELTICRYSFMPCSIADLHPVAASLVHLTVEGDSKGIGKLSGLSSLTCLSQLTSLCLSKEDLRAEDPWAPLAVLTSLKSLHLLVTASGDPSSLSALTGLSYLHVQSPETRCSAGPAPFTFSSLQPLSTLQQLEVLTLGGLSASSLTGLASLSKLRELTIRDAAELSSLNGLSTAVRLLFISSAPSLRSLEGIQGLQQLKSLGLNKCGVVSLQPLAELSSLATLVVAACPLASLAGLAQGPLSTSLQSLSLKFCQKLVGLIGVEGLQGLQQLEVFMCGVTSLRPVGDLAGGLKKLHVRYCKDVGELFLRLPHVQPTADVVIVGSNVKKVVLAGGVKRVMS